MKGFNEAILTQKIGRLPKDKQLAFALLLCERMMPALEQFSSETGFDSSIYRACLDDAWRHLESGGSPSASRQAAEQCVDHAPDTEEFDHPLTSEALNAALSMAATIGFLADSDVSHVVEAAKLARDTAASYAQNIEATPPRSLDFKEVMEHPIVQRELQQQTEDLQFLDGLPADAPQKMVPLIKEHATRTPALLPPENEL